MSNKSIENYPNVYDLQASEPIQEILVKYFTNIVWSFDFQEATLLDKKVMLQVIALEIDSILNQGKSEEGKLMK